jgi:hypothetical protein
LIYFKIDCPSLDWRCVCGLAFPYSTSVVFGPGDNGVAVIVEGTREDLVRVTLQNLQAIAAVRLPHPGRLVTIIDIRNELTTYTQQKYVFDINAENLEAVSMREPWGLKATLEISPSWPARMAACAYHTRRKFTYVRINII